METYIFSKTSNGIPSIFLQPPLKFTVPLSQSPTNTSSFNLNTVTKSDDKYAPENEQCYQIKRILTARLRNLNITCDVLLASGIYEHFILLIGFGKVQFCE